MDEPTLGLDVVGSQVVFDYVALLRQQKRAVIVSTHHLDEAGRLCDRFGLLFHGNCATRGVWMNSGPDGQPGLVEMFVTMLRDRSTTGAGS